MPFEATLPLPEMRRLKAAPNSTQNGALLRQRRTEAETGAKEEALERMEQLRSQMLRTMEILHSVRALFEVKPGVTRTEFRRFVQSALARLPELQALEWVPRVSLADRPAFEAAAAAEGVEGFHFKEINLAGGIAPARERAEYYPVFYAEPAQANAPVLGLDLAADPQRREALERSARTDLPTATSPLKLAQLSGELLGFLVVMPIRAADQSTSGFGLAVFQVGNLVDEIFSPLVWRGLSIEIRDSEDPSTPLYCAGIPDPQGTSWRYEQQLPLLGRTWNFVFAPSAQFNEADPNWLRRSAEILHRTNEALEDSVLARTAELGRLNEALQREVEVRKSAEAAAEAANRAKSLFLAEMSHEIRTPLNIILGHIQLLQRGAALAAAQTESVQAIAEGGSHLMCLIEGILDLTKIETGKMELMAVDFDLTTIMKALAAMFSPRCHQKGLQFRLEALGDRQIWVRGDERRLRQVLVNLLGNAVKFTDSGEVRLRVVPGVGTGAYRFEVIDTGPGIAHQAQRAIFEPFRQEAIGQARGGAGLGLSIARRLIELMGGVLEVNSAPGWGSDFFFTLSFAPSQMADPSRIESLSTLRLAPGRPVRALVFDAVRGSREVLQKMLAAVGCEVAAVDTVQEAVAAARERGSDVVLVDLRTPGLQDPGGWAAGLRAAGCKLIGFSARAFEHEQQDAGRNGCDGLLFKPFRMEQIRECLTRLLGMGAAACGPEAAEEPPRAVDPGQLRLPEELRVRLGSSAEIGDTAEIKKVLREIEQLGPNEGEFARRLLVSVGRFDTESVARSLEEVPVGGA